jgi:hypothetical protein
MVLIQAWPTTLNLAAFVTCCVRVCCIWGLPKKFCKTSLAVNRNCVRFSLWLIFLAYEGCPGSFVLQNFLYYQQEICVIFLVVNFEYSSCYRSTTKQQFSHMCTEGSQNILVRWCGFWKQWDVTETQMDCYSPPSISAAYYSLRFPPIWTPQRCHVWEKCDHGNMQASGFGGLGVSVLASGTQVRGFKPGRSSRIFKSGKILKHAFLQKGSKAVGPMSQICGM